MGLKMSRHGLTMAATRRISSCAHSTKVGCSACSYYEERIADLENSAWRRNKIARILIEENEPEGTWIRVAQIRSIRSTASGLEITVS